MIARYVSYFLCYYNSFLQTDENHIDLPLIVINVTKEQYSVFYFYIILSGCKKNSYGNT